ncbi:MAG: phage tail sheath family protein [Solirubrobacteraceae bacterium]
MPNYLTPGVYVEEIPAQSKPIEGVGTAIAAFVGLTPGGPVNTAVKISNWTQFTRIFGDKIEPKNGPFMEGAYLAHAVYGYFHNGGGTCYVTRVGVAEDATAQAALPVRTDERREAYRAVARPDVDGPVKLEIEEERPQRASESGDAKAPAADKPAEGSGNGGADKPSAGNEPTYRVVITAGSEREEYDGLTARSGASNIATKVNKQSKLIKLEETGAALPEVGRAPAAGSYELGIVADDAKELTGTGVEGDVANRTGIGGLAAIDEITMLCVPDLMALQSNGDTAVLKDLQGKMIAHCENAADRMAILDAPKGMKPQAIGDWRMDVAGYDSKFATLYYPWIEVMDPLSGGKTPLLIPPCGHVAGVWARSDGTRGVHKAPANEVLLAVNDLEFQITGDEQGALNKSGINCIRSFSGRGIRIWGARTLSSDPEWRYINVRRLFNYISESIMEGTQWAVFEPNDQRLWMKLKISATNFLTRTWREGALFGATPAEAFYVKCDAETNPPDLVEAGQVTVEIGVAPVKPAEFVVFRISQYQIEAGEAA